MPDSFKARLRNYLNGLNQHNLRFTKTMKNINIWKKISRKQHAKRPPPDTTWLTSSFIAMDISDQLKQVFEFYDENGDGKISPSEFERVLRSLDHEESRATNELAEEMVREVDCNGDGFIDLDEFMIVLMDDEANKVVEGGGQNGNFIGGGEKVLRDAFLVFDSDKDGFISAKELHRVLVRLGCGDCSLRDCRNMIKGVDRGGDGLVDFEEFKSMMTAHLAN